MATMQYKKIVIFLKENAPVPPRFIKALLADLEHYNLTALQLVGHGFSKNSLGIKCITALPASTTHTLGLVLGGDGTFLAAARLVYGTNIQLFGLNFGHLGFLSSLEPDAVSRFLREISAGKTTSVQRPYSVASVMRGKKILVKDEPFLNDIAIHREATGRMLRLGVDISGVHACDIRSDGLIISTPTGSTAYNLSAGGPIVHPSVAALTITPICAHTLTYRPLVVPPQPLEISIDHGTGHIIPDGRTGWKIQEGDKIIVQQSRHTLTQILPSNHGFFGLLREKMGWNTQLG